MGALIRRRARLVVLLGVAALTGCRRLRRRGRGLSCWSLRGAGKVEFRLVADAGGGGCRGVRGRVVCRGVLAGVALIGCLSPGSHFHVRSTGAWYGRPTTRMPLA